MIDDKLKQLLENIPDELKQTQKFRILESVVSTAHSVAEAAKKIPKTGKKRNIFIKLYNRRPMNKKKRSIAITQMAFSSFVGAMHIANIASTPKPKFPSAGKSHAAY